MAHKILVTGFDRFGPLKRPNKSSETVLPAIQERYGDRVETLVLPTAHDVAAEHLLEAIDRFSPAAIAMFGIAGASKSVRLERRAKNWRYSLLVADNLGKRAIGRIDPEGPARIDATLPLPAIEQSLSEADIPVRMSNSAGTFVCNEVMYRGLAHTRADGNQPDLPIGFVHIGNNLPESQAARAGLIVVEELMKLDGLQRDL